jgi:hypothetical protein
MDFSNILTHPDKEELLSKLLTGTAPKEINQWLRLKYSDKEQKHLIISVKCLQDFAKSEYSSIYNQYTQEITESIQRGQPIDKKVSESLLNNKTFKERLSEHALKEIDVRERFLSIDLIIRDRIEQVFDKMQENPGGWKGDYVILKWIEQYLNMVEKYDRSQNNKPDQLIQHNYTVQYIDRQTAAIQNAFKKVLSRVDPELALMLTAEISRELCSIEAPVENITQSVDDRLVEIQSLERSIKTGES